MIVCIPVTHDRGSKSPTSAHFGSASFYMLVDTESGACRALRNRNLHHAHGTCQPLASLQGEKLDAVVVSGIGMGALNKLLSAGLLVFQSEGTNVEEAVAALKAGTLRAMTADLACAGGHGPASK